MQGPGASANNPEGRLLQQGPRSALWRRAIHTAWSREPGPASPTGGLGLWCQERRDRGPPRRPRGVSHTEMAEAVRAPQHPDRPAEALAPHLAPAPEGERSAEQRTFRHPCGACLWADVFVLRPVPPALASLEAPVVVPLLLPASARCIQRNLCPLLGGTSSSDPRTQRLQGLGPRGLGAPAHPRKAQAQAPTLTHTAPRAGKGALCCP